MANNGYLVGDQCLDKSVYIHNLCVNAFPGYSNRRSTVWTSDGLTVTSFQCAYANPPSNLVYSNLTFSQFNCEIPGPIPPSSIPTVADGIALGWQAGAALILVGCILFMKKALK